MEGVEGEDEEEMLGGGLIEELRREKSAKKRLDMDEGEGGGEMEVEVKGKRSKRRKEEAPKDKESARGKKQSEKVTILSCVLARVSGVLLNRR